LPPGFFVGLIGEKSDGDPQLMRLLTYFLILLGVVTQLSAQTDFPGTDDKWRRYQSANFELFSRIREVESREMLHNLELLRAVFLDFFNLKERRRLEVTVYLFKSEKDYRTYGSETFGSKHRFNGFYLAGTDRAIIYLIPGENEKITRQLIFHEYIHHLFRVTEQNPPPWLNEGMAELFSTVEPKAGKLEFGQPIVGRLWQLQEEKLLPLENLFGVDRNSPIFRQGEHTGLFYAESWLLLHYLYFGDSKIEPDKRRQFIGHVLANDYRNAAAQRAGFQSVFGMDYRDMLGRLEAYLRSGRYHSMQIPLPAIATATTYESRAVPLADIRLRLAELALRASQSARAKLLLLQALEKDPTDTRVLEVLGAAALHDQDEQRARELWERAVEAGTRNAAIYRELALMESRARFSHFDVYFRLPEESVRRLRHYLLHSIEYNPAQSDAYEMLAWVEAFAPEPSNKNINAVQRAAPNLTRKERATLALAFVRVRLDRNEEALEMLAELEKLNPDPWEIYGIEAIRAFSEKRPIRPENLQPAAPSGHGGKILKPGG
jgi:tetratricopeptide (TPR) repeat protein